METCFPIGKPVTGKALVDREDELNTILDLARDGHSCVLVAPRRFGKTSLLLEVLSRLKKERYLIGDIDLFSVLSKRELAERIIETTLQNEKIPIRKILKSIKANVVRALQTVEFKQVVDEYGFILSLADRQKNEDALLDEAVDFAEKFARKKKKRLIMAYDEFNDLTKLNGEELLKKFRSKFQRHKYVTYLFSGSQESVMHELFGSKTQAFYRFGRILTLGPVEKSAFSRYIKETFERLNIRIPSENIERILSKTACHPYYTQLLCQHIFYSLKGERGSVKEEDIQDCYEKILTLEAPRFDEIWQELGSMKNHLAVLRTIATAAAPYELKGLSRQNINRILNSLEVRGQITKSGKGKYELTDSLFRDYIARM